MPLMATLLLYAGLLLFGSCVGLIFFVLCMCDNQKETGKALIVAMASFVGALICAMAYILLPR
jgi:hypothetical protein